MADQQHFAVLRQGVGAWNQWRKDHREIRPDLSGTDLSDTNLSEADLENADLRAVTLKRANLKGADLSGADLMDSVLDAADLSDADLIMAHLFFSNFEGTNLRGAHLYQANCEEVSFYGADLRNADLSEAFCKDTGFSSADLRGANLSGANCTGANFHSADVRGANLSGAVLNDADMRNALLTDCRVDRLAAWNVNLEGAQQLNLVLKSGTHEEFTIDTVASSQLFSLLFDPKDFQHILDIRAKNVVLILGHFADQRAASLEALKEVLRFHHYIPLSCLFHADETQPDARTLLKLAHLCRFVLLDLTDLPSLPQQIDELVLQGKIFIQPLLDGRSQELLLSSPFSGSRWVLPPYHYRTSLAKTHGLKEALIDPVEKMIQKQNAIN